MARSANRSDLRDRFSRSPSLARLLTPNNRWQVSTAPFPHLTASDVLEDALYSAIVSQTREILGSRAPSHVSGYDADILTLGDDTAFPLAVFLSPDWHDLLARVLRINATGDISVAIHRHPPGSRSGWVHNDLAPGWFVDKDTGGCLNNSSGSGCHYKTGQTESSLIRTREMVRAATLIYYIGNESRWTSEDGGETGLFTSASQIAPTKEVPPLGNSLLLFECTPFSFHSFRETRVTRTSIVMWLHRPRHEVTSLWGSEAIVPWRQ